MRELSSQFETFDVRKGEATAFIDKYGQEDIVLAGSLFVYTPQEAVYLFSGSYPEFNKFYAPALLQEYVMTQAIKRGIGFYNFLGIMGIFEVLMGFCDLNKTLMVISFVRWELSVIIHNR